jgi:hypothetical protein
MAAFDFNRLLCSLGMFGYPAYQSNHVTLPHNSQSNTATLARNRTMIIADTKER